MWKWKQCHHVILFRVLHFLYSQSLNLAATIPNKRIHRKPGNGNIVHHPVFYQTHVFMLLCKKLERKLNLQRETVKPVSVFVYIMDKH